MTAHFSAKWFVLYYPVLGCMLLAGGIGVMIKTDTIISYFVAESKNDQPPVLPRTILKYFFLFSLACLVLSFFPFSLIELLFSFWSLIIVYIAGIQLVRWPKTRQSIQHHPNYIKRIIQYTGVMMLALSPVMFLLCYLVITS